MDLVDDPETKKTYDKCKYIVKVWEHKFIKKYKRIPSKLDIKEAPTQVKHAYKKYFQLKSAALEQSFMDVEGFEDISQSQEDEDLAEFQIIKEYAESENNIVNIPEKENTTDTKELCENKIETDNVWGSHLNKHIGEDPKQNQKEKVTSKPVQSITKKLFCGSKFNKRNPRKSLSFTQKKQTDGSFESPSFLSQPASFKSEEAFADVSPEVKKFSFQESTTPVNMCTSSVPINIFDSVFESKQKESLKRVDKGWLKRVNENISLSKQSTDFCLDNDIDNGAIKTKLDYDSDDIIENSDDELQQSKKISVFHIAKKAKICYGSNVNDSVFKDITCSTTKNNITFENLNSNLINKEESQKDITESALGNPTELHEEASVKALKKIENVKRTKKKSTPATQQRTNSVHSPNLRKSSRSTMVKGSFQKLSSGEEDPFHSGNDGKDSESTVGNCTELLEETGGKAIKGASQEKEKYKNAKRTKKKSTPATHQRTESVDSPSLRRSSRSTMVKSSFQELSSGEEDPFHSDNDGKDPEFHPQDEVNKTDKRLFNFEETKEVQDSEKPPKSQDKKNRTKAGRKKTIGKQSDENIEDDPNSNYELEFSIKRRIVKPRYNSIKKLVKENLVNSRETSTPLNDEDEDKSLPKDKKQQAKEKLEQRITSGTLNENFVTINLRKKVFVRGKKGKNFSKYKKNLWKSKKKALYGPDMDMGGCDGGKLTCFNCGLEGHFARNCKAGKGDGLLPLEAQGEEECPFPTLAEASKMASESVLSIRKPKLAIEKKDSEDTNEESMECEPEVESEDEKSKNDEEDWPEDDIDSETLLAEMIKLEEHVKKIDVQAYMDNVKIVAPYYELNDQNVIDTPQEVLEALAQFGHGSFRGGQEKAVMRILSGKSTLVTLSTGSGKSLCYQLPAYLYSQREPCISLVISPLVSLMEDQVTGIPKFLKAACLHTNQTKTQKQKIMDALTKGEINILLISPEAVVAGEKQTGFGSLLRKLPPIAFACIDEAHCVSQWSHNFRPSYLMISRVLRESLGVKTILGLTATATRATCESIITSLDIPDGLEGIISDIPLPDNLYLTSSKDGNRDRALINLLLSERFKNCKSIIVYCTRRDECERIASFLRTSLKNETVVESTNKKRKRLNLQAEPYHAGLSASRRKSIQNAFMSGDLRVVVATVAFGMGINKSDIRAVIHFNMPNSFESYVQEVGRAGRDGLPAFCHVFLDFQGKDENELRRHIYANSIDRHVIRKLLQKIFVPCACKQQCPKHEVAFSIEETVRSLDIPEENISTLLCYLELHQNKYIELLNPAYTICKVISYGGPLQIRKAAKDCPPLAMALALYKNKQGEDNILEFPVVEVASAMGWESGICKHKLKNLEWTTVNNQPKRSSLSVQFTNLGFRLLAPGNLSDEALDEALDSLYKQVKDQESKALKQLHIVHKTLLEVAEKNYKLCIDQDENKEKGVDVLKQRIREYFNSPDPLADIGKESPRKINEEQLVNDIRAMICMYRDNQFTGRSLARIFQGIQSPNYPAVIWGRCKFWRSHLHEDFNEICRIATREIINLR